MTIPADLVVRDARCVATMDGDRRELRGGWVAVTDGLVSGVGTADPPPASTTIDATDCLVTPGLINAHHHLFQNLTRAYPPMTDKPLFGWLQSLYPLWRAIDTEAVYVSAWVGLAELALSGCTTSTDHLYLHPRGAGDLLTAEIEAARDLGVRFHPTRGSMSLSEKDGGLPPDDVVADDDEILAACEDAVARHHDRVHGAMTRIALAPCSPFTVTEELMVRTAELAERLDVRLHTHFAENAEDDEFSLATFGVRPMEYLERTGWCTDRTWVAHCVMPDPAEIGRLGAAGVGVAHCPSSNLILASGIAPVVDLRAAGVKVGLGVDGSSSADSASLWLEARQAMLLAKLRNGAGTARSQRGRGREKYLEISAPCRSVRKCRRSRAQVSASARSTMSPTSRDSFGAPAIRRSAASARARRPGSSARQLLNAVVRRAATCGLAASSARTVSTTKS